MALNLLVDAYPGGAAASPNLRRYIVTTFIMGNTFIGKPL